MTFEYSLNENDFLQHQLFAASKNVRIKKKRRRNWMILSAAILGVAFIFYQQQNMFITWCCLTYAAITILFYPLFERRHYKNHYKKYIADVYKNRFGQLSKIEVSQDHINMYDSTGESKLNTSAIDNIHETGAYIYLRMNMGDTLIVPKDQIANVNDTVKEFTALSKKWNIPYVAELNWKWK